MTKAEADLIIKQLDKLDKIEDTIRDFSTPSEDGSRFLRESDAFNCVMKIIDILGWKRK